MATSTPDWSTGAVSMKMRSRTRTTSTSGVMLISASAVCVSPFAEKAIGLEGPPSWLFGLLGLCGRSQKGGVLDGVEKLAAEVIHARGELPQTCGELVVADDSGDGDDEAGGGRDESFRDAGSYGAQCGCTCGAQSVEGVDDAHDSSEEADEGGDGGDCSQPGHAALHAGECFARCGLGGAFEGCGIAGKAAAAVLTLVLVVDLGEDGHQRAGLELLGDRGNFAETA